MPHREKREIRIAIAVQGQPDKTSLLTNDMGAPLVDVGSIDGHLGIVDAWAKRRLARNDAKGAKRTVDVTNPSVPVFKGKHHERNIFCRSPDHQHR